MALNILIVDDSAILRTCIRKVARVAGFTDDHIFEASNGEEALEVLEMVKTDLVLLDLNMPVMDGETFTRNVRQRPEIEDTAIVVVSTEANEERLDRLRGLGVLEILHKPFEPEDLVRIVGHLAPPANQEHAA